MVGNITGHLPPVGRDTPVHRCRSKAKGLSRKRSRIQVGNQPDEQTWRKKRTRWREKLVSLSTGHSVHCLI